MKSKFSTSFYFKNVQKIKIRQKRKNVTTIKNGKTFLHLW